MAVMMFMEWDGVVPEQYEALRRLVDWEGQPPAGGILHVASFADRGIRIVDVWESAEAFQTFVSERLMPGVAQLGVAGEPKVDIRPMHALFAPVPLPV
jgi:hypothetical protein